MTEKAWPILGKKMALAHDPKFREGKVYPQPFMRPPTVNGVVNIGMEGSVHLPDLAAQKSGFTPYVMRGNKAEDATQLLLEQFPGIYKPVTEKGDSK